MIEAINNCEKVLNEKLQAVNELKLALESVINGLCKVKLKKKTLELSGLSTLDIIQNVLKTALSGCEENINEPEHLDFGTVGIIEDDYISTIGLSEDQSDTCKRSNACLGNVLTLEDLKINPADSQSHPSCNESAERIEKGNINENNSDLFKTQNTLTCSESIVKDIRMKPAASDQTKSLDRKTFKVIRETCTTAEDSTNKDKAELLHGNSVVNNSPINKIFDVDEVIFTELKETAGPVVGKKYMVNVESPFNNGTFWINRKEESSSRIDAMAKMIRLNVDENSPIQADNTNSLELVCVLSDKHRIWMRALIEKEVSSQKVVVRYVDNGKAEEVPRSKIYHLPDRLKEIPRMAFHCSLFAKDYKFGYEVKWRFKDLSHQSLIYFTYEKTVTRNGLHLLCGQFHTIVNPTNIGDEIFTMLDT